MGELLCKNIEKDLNSFYFLKKGHFDVNNL